MGPVEKIANRLVRKRSLTPPINVEALIRERASLSYDWFPVDGIDGLCLNMKGGPDKARVIISKSLVPNRKRFTLAHELGHLVIPWHVGSTVDTINLLPAEAHIVGEEYYEMEAEADRFAAELLMPEEWVIKQMTRHTDLAQLHEAISTGAEVSPLAAAIRLVDFLPSGIVWVIESAGKIQSQGFSLGTLVSRIWDKEHVFDEHMYSYAHEHYKWSFRSKNIHWWVLPSEIPTQSNDNRTWREVLAGMIADIGYDDPAYQTQSFSGVVGSINSKLKKQSQLDITVIHSPSTLAAACLQRFAHPDYSDFYNHSDFMVFIKKRAESIFEDKSKSKSKKKS